MNDNITQLGLELNALYAHMLWPNTIFNAVCIVVGLFGNGYVLYINKFKLMDNSEARYFIPYLAMADTCAVFITCIYSIVRNYYLLFPENDPCKGFYYGEFVVVFTSAALLLVIAVQRYTLSKPFGRQFTLFWRRAALAIIVIGSVCFSIPMASIAGLEPISTVYKGANITGFICWIRDTESPTLQNIYFGIAAIVLVVNIAATIVLYVPLAIVIYRRQKTTPLATNIDNKLDSSGNDTTETASQDTDAKTSGTLTSEEYPSSVTHPIDNHNKAENTKHSKTSRRRAATSPSTNFNIMFITIFVVYVLTYIPTGVTIIAVLDKNPVTWIDLPEWRVQAYSILAQTFVINNVANPFIYGYFDMQFRKQVVRHCNMICCCRR